MDEKIEHIISLKAGVCVYCSWTQTLSIVHTQITHEEGQSHNHKTQCSGQRLFHSLGVSSLNYRGRCLQCSSSMLCPLSNQWIAPTHQPKTHQNRWNTYIANPLHGTNPPHPRCSSFDRAHLLSTWDVVVVTVGLCIHG